MATQDEIKLNKLVQKTVKGELEIQRAVKNELKIQRLVQSINKGTVVLPGWLESIGISRDLQKHYLKSGWLESVGRGAYKKTGDEVEWNGGLYAIQTQTNTNVHVGSITALAVQGLSHYFRLGQETIYLFSLYKNNLPKWFKDCDWKYPVYHQQTDFLPEETGIVEHEIKNIPVMISSPERAIMECLYLAPKKLDLAECYHLMEGLVNLKPKLIQELLQTCNSVHVKRLFLYLSEKADHQWLNFVDTSFVDLGSGNRRITEGGVYISKYQITIPKELAEL